MPEHIVQHGIKVAKDFTPETFGRLTTIGPVFRAGKTWWQVFQCSCGGTVVARAKDVKRLFKRSCGCYYRDTREGILKTHGKTGTLEHRIWKGMLTRCNNPRVKQYKNYGGRGIKVFVDWSPKKNDKGVGFLTFLGYMGECPADKNSIDRIDNDKGYEPGNVRWATTEQQANNKQGVHLIDFAGELLSVAQWARKIGISRKGLARRLKTGWSIEDALTLPVNSRKPKTESGV